MSPDAVVSKFAKKNHVKDIYKESRMRENLSIH